MIPEQKSQFGDRSVSAGALLYKSRHDSERDEPSLYRVFRNDWFDIMVYPLYGTGKRADARLRSIKNEDTVTGENQ